MSALLPSNRDALVGIRARLEAEFRGESSAHDLHHLDRVAELARNICQRDACGEEAVVMAAAYLHDLHRHMERREQRAVCVAECDALTIDYLDDSGLPRAWHEEVLDAIHYTDHYSFGTIRHQARFETSRAVRDADNLDAIGAIGIARTFTYGGKVGEPIWDGKPSLAAAEYDPLQKASSVVAHMHDKLLRIVHELETPTARALGEKRHLYMQQFLEQLHADWHTGFG